MKSPLRESCPEMLLHVVKEEHALGVKQRRGTALQGQGIGIVEGLRDRIPTA